MLVVDDDPGVTQLFARILRLGGYGVLTALDAVTALQHVEQTHPDIVLLDLRMPVVDGLAFLRSMRTNERERYTPVAVITGDYAVDDRLQQQLSALGAAVYFKPVWLEDLLGITRDLLRTKH